MKAVGARNATIRTIFLIESGFLGAVGGAIGVVLGVLIAKAGEKIAWEAGNISLHPYVSIWLILGAIVFSFLIGALSGTLPAMQAAKLNPVDCLRGTVK